MKDPLKSELYLMIGKVVWLIKVPIAVQGSGFQPRDKHSRATGFSKAGIPKNFDLQRGDTPGLGFFLARG